jgi:cobalamin synthase
MVAFAHLLLPLVMALPAVLSAAAVLPCPWMLLLFTLELASRARNLYLVLLMRNPEASPGPYMHYHDGVFSRETAWWLVNCLLIKVQDVP